MRRLSRLREEKRRARRERDAALSARHRMELAAAHLGAARTLFMAGMAARGVCAEKAELLWRQTR